MMRRERYTHHVESYTHTPCGGLTEAMWDCAWNNKQRDVSGGLEDREPLTCWPALSNSLDSATERTRNDLRHMKFKLMVGVSSKWLIPGWCETAPSVRPGAQQSTSLPSLCLHSSMTVSHAVFIIWIGGCWHQSVGCEAKLKINAWESLKCTIKSKCVCREKHIWTYVS